MNNISLISQYALNKLLYANNHNSNVFIIINGPNIDTSTTIPCKAIIKAIIIYAKLISNGLSHFTFLISNK